MSERAERFTIQRVTSTIAPAPDDGTDGPTDAEYDEGPVEPGDLRAVIDALESDCWDSLQESGDGTVIGYPADYAQDMRTGEYSADHVIVKGSARNVDRALALYRAREAARRARFERMMRR